MISDYIKAVILGILEGLTEFIPVSSTGHLILVGNILNFEHGNVATFNIAIQLGAILAVVVIYSKFFYEILRPSQWHKPSIRHIIIAIMPVLVLGLLGHSFIKSVLFHPISVAYALIVGGLAMILVDRFKARPTTDNIDDMSVTQALMVGLCQCAALWPGFSRSGATLMGGLLARMTYDTSARFSFIIAVPVMLVAVLYDLWKTAGTLSIIDGQLIAIGFLVSFFVALIAIVSFLKLLLRFRLFPFAIYRILIGIFILSMY